MSGAGKATLAPYAGNVTVEGYDADKQSILIPDVENIAGAVLDKTIEIDGDKIKLEGATVKLVDSTLANFVTESGDVQKVGFIKSGALNLEDRREDYLIAGGANSTITAGNGNDTIFGGKRNSIDAGAGNNLIELDGTGDATIILSGGKDTIRNFNASFDAGDKISIDAANADFKFNGKDLSIKGSAARALLENVSSDDGSAKILTISNGKEVKTAVAQSGAIISADEELADVYIGENSGVDFTGYDDSLLVDLSDEQIFRGINQVVSGTGETTIIGGAGKNILIGQAGNEDKRGSTAFIVSDVKNGTRNTISGFEFIEDGGENPATFDNLNLGLDDGNEVIDLKTDGYDLAMIIGSANGAREKIVMKDATGKEFMIDRGKETETVAQIAANEVSINNSYVDFYAATEKHATVTIGDVRSAKVWLEAPDFSDDVEFVGDFAVIDARGSEAQVEMAGNNVANTIYGGLGNASMWGGAGSANDLMIGGTAHNEFYYEIGNGNDTIAGVNDGDIIDLSEISLEQISEANLTTNGAFIKFNDGGSLHVEGRADVTYQLADGSKYSANHQKLEWTSK